MSALEGYPVVVDVPVRWGDMDAYGHVNNAVYLTYFEDARIAYFKALELPGWVTPGQAAVQSNRASHGREGKASPMPSTRGAVGPIVHSTKCRYRIPVTYPDTLQVGCRIDDIAADRFTMTLAAWSVEHGAIAADGQCIVVVYDYAARAKASVSPELRAAIARVQGAA